MVRAAVHAGVDIVRGSTKWAAEAAEAQTRTWPEAPMIRMRPRGFMPTRCGRRTASVGALVSLGDMTGTTPDGTGHATSKSGSRGWLSFSLTGLKQPCCR